MIVAFEPLAPHHDRAGFSSGNADLDDWFRRRARQDDVRQIARVFVAIDEGGSIAGFYSLSSHSIAIEDLPAAITRKLPRYGAIPAALVGQLARDQRWAGQGIGDLSLVDAVRRVLAASRQVAVFAVLVDAIDETAATFYAAHGFQPLASRPRRLFLPLASVAAGLA